NGDWTATDIPVGDATVDVDETTLPADITDTLTTTGSDPETVTVVDGTNATTDDGYAPALGDLSGTVFEDTNGNGVQDAGEAGIAGVDVVVTDVDGNPTTVTTDANGDWTATDIPVGDATVDVDETTLPADITDTLTTTGSDPETVTVVEGTNTTTDDGYAPALGDLSGTVFEDTNGNGVQDAGEAGIAGVDVVVTDVDGNPTTVTTDANGDWTLNDVALGDATVDVDETTLPADITDTLTTTGSDPETVTVVEGTNTTTDDGYAPALGDLSGTVFEDTNGNGVQDAGEAGIAGVEVIITDVDNNPTTVTTDANGDWTATDIPVGDATVDVDETTLPADITDTLTTTGSDPETVTVVEGTNATTDDGYAPAVGDVSGTVFEDTNGNGVQDAGEAGIAGVTVTITDVDNNPTTVTTDANGDWTATDIPVG
ncbi:beta strand repeat-containing protein, partial [Mesoflavibacter zeaxanthinifaciens]|uniref:beta strand repeat-containing protein n=1 Tax=Mesoflavibacter zeaxanthinifaciens TaxID=393060 RepID=UPI00055EBA87